MLSRLNSDNGISFFDVGWNDTANYLGLYDDWLNYTGSYMVDRKLVSTSETAILAYSNYLGDTTYV